MSNFYLGNVSDLSSNMGSMFGPGGAGAGAGGGIGGNTIVPHVTGPQQPGNGQPGNGQPQQTPGVTGSTPSYGGAFNPLGAQGVRPTSFGQMDQSYGQNLATAVGSSFQRPQQNQALQFNPYGNLTDANVKYPNNGGGNAPLPGLPQTMLQWSQMFNPSVFAPPQTTDAKGNTVGTQVGVNAQGSPIFD